MTLITLHNGRRGITRGRTCEGCLLILFMDDCTWSWMPNALVASRQPLSPAALGAVLDLSLDDRSPAPSTIV